MIGNLTDTTSVILARVLVGIGVVGGVAGMVAYLVSDPAEILNGFALDEFTGVLTAGGIAWLALPRRPRNGALWVLTIVAFTLGVSVFGGAIGFAITGVSPTVLQDLGASDFDTAGAVAFFFPQTLWPNFLLFLTFGILLFPDGRLPSPRWKWFARVVAGALVVLTLTSAWLARPWSADPYTPPDVNPIGIVGGTAAMAVMLSVFVCLGSLIMRYRRSDGAERQQFRWMVWGFSVFILATILNFAEIEYLETFGGPLSSFVIAASYGVAITKYRLYEIDVIISKTVLYALLAAFIGGVYAFLVVGIGSWLGAGTSNIALSIAATALVAVVFEPVRARAQRFANRVVYGSRSTPYQVLSDLTARLASAESTDGLLERMVHRLADGTGAVRAELILDGQARPTAKWPDEGEGSDDVGTGFSVPITSGDVILGELRVVKSRGDTLTPTEQRLLEDLAGSAGMVLSKVRLDDDLAARAQDLRESRRRMVDAQGEEQRRLERDLHDGAQQQIVALKVKLGLAERFALDEGSDSAAELIGQMADDAQQAIEEIRSLAKGIFPPLLENEGLSAALATGAANAPIPVIVDSDGLRRMSIDVEAAAYFCISEAITNAVKYSGAHQIGVGLDSGDGGLRFSIRDDGSGFDPATTSGGSGVVGMRDRLEALGGSLSLESAPGEGTTVSGFVPGTPID
jgi:signal transduction histidine kinase